MVYRLWIAAQVVLFWSIVPLLIAALVAWNYRYVVAALALAVVHGGVSTFGAVSLWELANVTAFMEGAEGATTSFGLEDARQVMIGRGWSRNGLWLAIPPYVLGVNQWAEGYCVSFEAPNGDTRGNGVYALHVVSKEAARVLADLLTEGT